MKTSTQIATETQLINELNNAIATASINKPSFGAADLWSIQKSRKVRSVRKLMFN